MTAIVGRLRPQVRVVDVDLEGARGDAAVELVAAWCRQKDLWHLVRPSGGGHGRAHVFVAVDELAAELEVHVAQIRAQLRGTRRALDVRDTVRPLSSPHRSGAATKPFGNLSEALLGLRRHPWATMPHKPRKRRSGAPVSATAAIPIRRRHRTDLPGPWRDYLAHGALPLIRVDDPDPAGPATGVHHVIRGSSFMHSTVTELRASFRDYGGPARPDVGFRVARSAEP